MGPEAWDSHSGQPRPGLPAVQQFSREKQEPPMKPEHRHDTYMAPAAAPCNKAAEGSAGKRRRVNGLGTGTVRPAAMATFAIDFEEANA